MNKLKTVVSLLYRPVPAHIERGGVTDISKDNVREMGYNQANCIVFLPK